MTHHLLPTLAVRRKIARLNKDAQNQAIAHIPEGTMKLPNEENDAPVGDHLNEDNVNEESACHRFSAPMSSQKMTMK